LRAAAASRTTVVALTFSTMPLPAAVAALIETFRNNEADYARPDFKEAQLRQQFLDPLFAALGWDMANTAGYAEAYKEVVHEDAIFVRGETKAPDYAFRIGGQRKFFAEAKKPSINIKDDPAPALQLRSYSWVKKLPLGILTDFQEISIYDTRVGPRAGDKASVARLFHWRCTELPAKWDEFAGIFSKEAVLKGNFDRFANAKRGKGGTSDFDTAFLADMEKWRELLARNIALRNPGLGQRELNFSVQRVLDRIIFLRRAESRGIEPVGQLQALIAAAGGASEGEPASGMVGEPAAAYRARRQTIYPRLCEIFARADFRYNSGLFHFETEKGRDEAPDRLTLALLIDDAVFKEIIKALYWPGIYAFNGIEADILGSIYERFLGKTIRLTDGHRAVVEEKPEVRKAGGVYYTPNYIVDYIVGQTLGPLLENKTPAQAGEIKVLDPACGSGAFLVGAYQHLLDRHLQYYINNDPKKWARKKNPPVYETSPNALGIGKGDGNWQLTTAERKRILINNIHGVDIDAQAVEVTKLALLLKVLEGEARELQGRQTDFHRVLPDLGKNIHCGNSLVGHDFYEQLALPDLSEDDKYRINTFEWSDGFPEIMKSGGFDAVIGNPPYVLLQDARRDDEQLDYFKRLYKIANYKLDTYHLFIERGVGLLGTGGRLGFITPSNYLTNNHLVPLRTFLLKETQPVEIIVIEDRVFAGASVDTAITILSQGKGKPAMAFPVKSASVAKGLEIFKETRVVPGVALKDKNVLLTGASSSGASKVYAKCVACGEALGAIAHVNFGKQLRDRSVFKTDVIEVASISAIPRTHAPCYTGRDATRYMLKWGGLACLASDEAQCGGCWDGTRHHAENKILTRQIGKTPVFCLDERGFDCLNSLFMVNVHDEAYSPYYVLGLLNSKLLAFIWLEKYYDKRLTFPKIKGGFLKLLPIARASLGSMETIKKNVECIISLKLRLSASRIPDEQTRLQREITATDRRIDTLVYQLYGLTEAEIALVEQAAP
jgi:hypothetical protein